MYDRTKLSMPQIVKEVVSYSTVRMNQTMLNGIQKHILVPRLHRILLDLFHPKISVTNSSKCIRHIHLRTVSYESRN